MYARDGLRISKFLWGGGDLKKKLFAIKYCREEYCSHSGKSSTSHSFFLL